MSTKQTTNIESCLALQIVIYKLLDRMQLRCLLKNKDSISQEEKLNWFPWLYSSEECPVLNRTFGNYSRKKYVRAKTFCARQLTHQLV